MNGVYLVVGAIMNALSYLIIVLWNVFVSMAASILTLVVFSFFLQIQDNISLFCQIRDNLATIFNEYAF